MSLKEALGFGPDKKVRYAIVGLGDIAQEALMPGVEHTGNSVMTALVSGNRDKSRALAERYSVFASYDYEEFGTLLSSGKIDAIYLATPNWRHAEFAVPALRAGIHVLLEKPMEVSVAKCREILEAQSASNAKLMIAYRLHFEPATLSVIELVRTGRLGEIRAFSSVFAQKVKPDNHRATSGVEAGPLFDMGPYPVNAVRNIFETEPIEVSAFGSRHPEAGLGNFDDTIAVTLRFPENRLAQFVVSYVGNAIDSYTVLGSSGSVVMSPAYMYNQSLEYTLTTGEDKKHESFKHTDHFGGELKYFSDCILQGKDPEPDGEEGLLDLRVIEAAVRSIETASSQKLEPMRRGKHINPDQQQKLSAVKPPEPLAASAPAQ
jgi:predicted dehydrogenase